MNQLFASVLIGTASLAFAVTASAAPAHSRATYNATFEKATADGKAAQDKCDALSGNAKDVCIEQAKAVEGRAKADAKAQYKRTRKTRTEARIAAADGDFAVAAAKCRAKAGNDQDFCVEEAQAVHAKAIEDAKSTKKVADASADAREAEYRVALQKCDTLSAAGKDSCVEETKDRFLK